MSDVRDAVALALAQPLATTLDRSEWTADNLIHNSSWGELFYSEADIAISAVLGWLEASAEKGSGDAFGLEYSAALADWVRSHRPNE